MPISQHDIQVVTHSALGMGIPEKDILFIEDWSSSEMNQAFQQITREFMEIGAQGKRSFLYVYCLGKGVLERQQYMILNSTQENLFNLEQACINVCKQTKNMCTVFSVYDMKKDFLIRYPGLQKSNVELDFSPIPDVEADKKLPFWFLQSTETLGVAKSSHNLARELLERLQQNGSDGSISFPDTFSNFSPGKIGSTAGAVRFSI